MRTECVIRRQDRWERQEHYYWIPAGETHVVLKTEWSAALLPKNGQPLKWHCLLMISCEQRDFHVFHGSVYDELSLFDLRRTQLNARLIEAIVWDRPERLYGPCRKEDVDKLWQRIQAGRKSQLECIQ